MALIKNGHHVADLWLTASDDTPVQADIPTIVSYQRFLADRENLLRSCAQLGVKLSPGDKVSEIARDLARLSVVALDFPAFTDGRAYSYARELRQRHGYEGEIRATGDVLRDQYLNMHRAGFDAYEVQDGATTRAFLDALSEFSHHYQPAANGSEALWAVRHGNAAGKQALAAAE